MIPGMPRAPYNPDVIKITKLDADGVPAGDPVSVTGRISIREEIRPTGRVPHPRYIDLFKDEEVLMYDPATRRTTKINTGDAVRLTPEQERARKEMLSRLHSGLDIPPFLADEMQREDEHAWQVRRDKKRKELAEMYGAAPAKWLDAAADQQTPRFPPSPPVHTIHEHYVMGAGPVRYQYSLDPGTGREKWDKIPSCSAAPSVAGSGGWIAPPAPVYDQEPQTVNHPCTVLPFEVPAMKHSLEAPELHPCSPSCRLNIDAPGIIFPDWLHDKVCKMYTTPLLQEEADTDMTSTYGTEARSIANRILQQERENREAEEIIAKVKAFGEDIYADGTVLRFSRELFDGRADKLLPATVWTALRFTDECGKAFWSDDQGTNRNWDALISWFVTVGKPITPADIEVWAPTPKAAESGAVVSTTITGIVQ